MTIPPADLSLTSQQKPLIPFQSCVNAQQQSHRIDVMDKNESLSFNVPGHEHPKQYHVLVLGWASANHEKIQCNETQHT